MGFYVRCHLHGAKYDEVRINFPCGAIDQKEVLYRYIRRNMVGESSRAKWPAGPLPKIVLMVYGFIFLVWYESHGGEDLSFLPNEWAEHLPKREALHWGFLAIVLGHTILAIACCWVLFFKLKLGLPRKSMPSWALSCLLLGYPAWCQILALKRARTQGILRRL